MVDGVGDSDERELKMEVSGDDFGVWVVMFFFPCFEFCYSLAVVDADGLNERLLQHCSSRCVSVDADGICGCLKTQENDGV
jgi:hypothetical protein